MLLQGLNFRFFMNGKNKGQTFLSAAVVLLPVLMLLCYFVIFATKCLKVLKSHVKSSAIIEEIINDDFFTVQQHPWKVLTFGEKDSYYFKRAWMCAQWDKLHNVPVID